MATTPKPASVPTNLLGKDASPRYRLPHKLEESSARAAAVHHAQALLKSCSKLITIAAQGTCRSGTDLF